jgi:hypothetical protein
MRYGTGGAALVGSQIVIRSPLPPGPAPPHPLRYVGPALRGVLEPTALAPRVVLAGVESAAALAEDPQRWGQPLGLPLTPAALPVGGGEVVRHWSAHPMSMSRYALALHNWDKS